MVSATKIVPNFYRDSVSLMQISARLGTLPGIARASAVMASEANLALLREAGLLAGPIAAGPNDLLIALLGERKEVVEAALGEAEAALSPRVPVSDAGARDIAPRSLEMALEGAPDAGLALVSTPGDYAAAEAMKALRLGLDVMLFSDNVALADEVELKRFAHANGRIVMGPDCGTAILGGIPLGFANAVRRGRIGAIGASGTGLQQVTCLIDAAGEGVSHAIGTGSHDLNAEVGAITMLDALGALARDRATRVIVLISKPPAPEVAARVLARARKAGKPVVAAFLGWEPEERLGANVRIARTLEDAALAAVALAQGKRSRPASAPRLARLPRLTARQRYLRALYSGGTFSYEAALLLGPALDPAPIFSNAPAGRARPLADPWRSEAHSLVDLGDDRFTRGRPHPMIDQRLRNERILREAADPEVAAILLDVVLGHGAHPDPAAEIAPVVAAARARARRARRNLVFVGFVCGTDADPQNRGRQAARLREAGMILAASNAQAVRIAARIAQRAAGRRRAA